MNNVRAAVALVVALIFALAAHVANATATPTSIAMSRNVQFAHVTTASGLSQQFVQSVVQDGRGYIWFGTQEGLNRFDGHDVRVYQHDRGDRNSISNNFIWALYVDRSGVLWVGTDHGLNRYDADTDSFSQPFAALGGANTIGEKAGGRVGEPRVRSLVQDRNGVFWLGTVDAGLLAIDPGRQHVERWLNRSAAQAPASAAGVPAGAINALLEDSKGQLWVGSDGGGLARFDRVTRSFVVYRNVAGDASSLSDDHIRAIEEDHSGRIWIGTSAGGVNLLDALTGAFERFQHDPHNPRSLNEGEVSAILEDHTGTLWVGTEAGLCELRSNIKGFVCYRHDPLDASSLINDRVSALFEDRSGVLWLGTHGGVSRWNRVSESFSYYRSANGFLEADMVSSVAEARDGSLWVGTYGGGVSRVKLAGGMPGGLLDGASGAQVQHFRHDPANAASLSDDRVMTVYVDANNVVWVGTRNGGLNRLTADGRGFQHFVHNDDDPTTLSGNAITSMQSDAHGALWVGVFDGGLNRMAADGHFEHFRHETSVATTLASDRVLALFRDHAGRLWIGAEQGGLSYWDEPRGRFLRVAMHPVRDAAEHIETVWDINESGDGSLWVATLGEGLWQWSGADRARGVQRFRSVRKADGLASDTIYGVVEGAPGVLWLSSSQGLSALDTNSGTTRYFDLGSGLRGNEFNLGARLRSRTGRLYFGSTDGLVGFYPTDLQSNRLAPPVSVTANARDHLLARAITGGGVPRIELGYLDAFVAFDFVGLDFVSPEKNKYRYWMEGLDADWIDADRFRRAVYTKLPPGRYTFHVQAANNDNIWNNLGAAIVVHVQPPPWATPTAYAAYCLALLAMVGLVWRRQRVSSARRAALQAQLEREVAARTRELAESMENLQRMNAQLAEASLTDALTGLRNRRYLDQVMPAQVALVERRVVEGAQAVIAQAMNSQSTNSESFNSQPVAADVDHAHEDSSQLMFFMMIDLDGFKVINDTHGHHAGDEALLQVKAILLECCRQSDSVVRWGGDEFMIVGHVSGFYGAKVLAERIREGISTHRFKVAGAHYCSMTASIGLAPFPFCAQRVGVCRWEQVAAVADQCAYLAKTNGRNAWVSAVGTTGTGVADLQNIAAHLERAAEGRLIIDASRPLSVLLAAASSPPPAALATA